MSPSERFIRAYIECALWSSTDQSDDSGGDPLDKNYGPQDIDNVDREKIRRDCLAFILDCRQFILAGPLNPKADPWEQAGHDFWLTRNGHGAGFSDGDWPKEAGERMTKAAEVFGKCEIYVGDEGGLYVS